MSKEEELIPVLYNSQYGGFGFSDEVVRLYKERTNKDIDYIYCERTDKILIDLCLKLGDKANNKYCTLKVEYIPKKYEKYIQIREYDGLESVCIDYKSYKMDKIKEICNNNDLTNSEKVIQIKNVF